MSITTANEVIVLLMWSLSVVGIIWVWVRKHPHRLLVTAGLAGVTLIGAVIAVQTHTDMTVGEEIRRYQEAGVCRFDVLTQAGEWEYHISYCDDSYYRQFAQETFSPAEVEEYLVINYGEDAVKRYQR